MLGEISAFGGINVEPSVRSCFEKAGDTGFIEVTVMMLVTISLVDNIMIIMVTMAAITTTKTKTTMLITTTILITIPITITIMMAKQCNDEKNCRLFTSSTG